MTHLLLIDVQRDFCDPDGALYVHGAVDDNERLAAFIRRNVDAIDDLTCTLDSHLPNQIFFPSFWRTRDGVAPAPHRVVCADDVRAGELTPAPELARWLCDGDQAWLRRQAEHYCAELERAGRYQLYLWPPHCLVGSPGHALAPVIQQARLDHAYRRGARAGVAIKGLAPLTESYSVFGPEVAHAHDGRPLAPRETALLAELARADRIIVAGQAASHCVKSSVDDLLDAMPELAPRLYVLVDCMSSVVVPGGPDFAAATAAAQARWAEAGAQLVTSTAWEP